MIYRIILILSLAWTDPAYGQPSPGSDPNSPMAQWYKSLMIPGTHIDCCGQSHCRPARARRDGGVWEAENTDGTWIQVPESRIIRDKTHPAGSAVICVTETGPPRPICFVPPTTGG